METRAKLLSELARVKKMREKAANSLFGSWFGPMLGSTAKLKALRARQEQLEAMLGCT